VEDSCAWVVPSLDPLAVVVVSPEELLAVVVDPDAVVVSSGDLVAPSSLVGAAVVVVSEAGLEVVDC
jgi:hypothetical protein